MEREERKQKDIKEEEIAIGKEKIYFMKKNKKYYFKEKERLLQRNENERQFQLK